MAGSRRGGSEDPWLCVPGFYRGCLCPGVLRLHPAARAVKCTVGYKFGRVPLTASCLEPEETVPGLPFMERLLSRMASHAREQSEIEELAKQLINAMGRSGTALVRLPRLLPCRTPLGSKIGVDARAPVAYGAPLRSGGACRLPVSSSSRLASDPSNRMSRRLTRSSCCSWSASDRV